jgi:integrase
VASEHAFGIVSTRPTLLPDQAYALVTKWLRDTLVTLETGRALGFDYLDAGLLGIDDPELAALTGAIQPWIAGFSADMWRDALKSNDISKSEEVALALANHNGIKVVSGSADAKILARMVTRALLEINQDIGRRLDGVFPPLHQEAPNQHRNMPPPPLPPAPKGIQFAEGFRLHEADMSGSRAAPDKPWTEQTRRQNAKTIELWIELFGDRPVDAYTRDDAVAFKRALEHLPKNHGKSPNDTRTMPEIVKAVANAARDDRPQTIAMKTVKRHMSALSGFFGWLLDRPLLSGIKGVNIFLNFKYGVASSEDDRLMWEAEDLNKLFATPIWTGSLSSGRRSLPGDVIIKDHRFWLPLIALFHGTRQEEAAQLRAADIQQEGGIWFFNIHRDGGNQLKNAQSIRRVPVHRFVIEAGFLDYVEEARAAGRTHLWPSMSRSGPDGKFAYAYSKFFGLYCRATGVYVEGRGFHSLRHTFRTFTEETDTKSMWISRLMGHKLTALLGEGATYTKTTSRKVSLAMLKEAVDAFDPGVDLSHLRPKHKGRPSQPPLAA